MDADGKMDVLSASMNTGLLLHHNLGNDIFEEIQIPAELITNMLYLPKI
jgi:hypothetical protein